MSPQFMWPTHSHKRSAMAPSRGVCFEGRMFFVYDREAVKKEEDPPENAILYFYPPATKIEQQITICGQLVGMANFLSGFTGKRSPCLIKLQTEKVAMIHVGKYSLVLGGTLMEPDSLLSRQLETLYHVFAFYHGSIDHVRRLHQERSTFLEDMRIIWDCYLPFVRHYGDHLPGVFDPIPFLDLPKKAAAGFMKASRFLQACQRRRHILVGCLLYNNSVLCSQLDPDIMSRLLLLKPNQSHHPAQPVKTDFSLPYGLRILDCFVTLSEYATLYNAVAQSPYRQLNAANSSGTFPDVYTTPANFEGKNPPTEAASAQSNGAHSDVRDSKNREAVVEESEKASDSRKSAEFEETRESTERKNSRTELGSAESNVTQLDRVGSDSRLVETTADSRKSVEFQETRDSAQDEGCGLDRAQQKLPVLPNSSQAAEQVDGRVKEEHVSLDEETANNGEEGKTKVSDSGVNVDRTTSGMHAYTKEEVLNNDGKMESVLGPKQLGSRTLQSEFDNDGGGSATPDAPDELFEHEVVMEAIDVQEIRVIECFHEEWVGSVAEDAASTLQPDASRAPEATAESRQVPSPHGAVCFEGERAADGGETDSFPTDGSSDSRTFPSVADIGDVSAIAHLESLCREFLDDIIEEVTAQLETPGKAQRVSGKATRSEDAAGFGSGPGICSGKTHEGCLARDWRDITSASLSSGNGCNAGAHISCDETAPSLCCCAGVCKDCSSSSSTTATTSQTTGTTAAALSLVNQAGDSTDESLVASSVQPLPSHNVTFENSIEVFCVKETGGDEHDQRYKEKGNEEHNKNQVESRLADGGGHSLEAQADSSSPGVTHSLCLEADSGLSVNNSSQAEDSAHGAQEPGESESGARPSASRDRVPSGDEAAEQDANQVEGMVHVSLYVQAHSEIVLILLADPGLKSDQETIRALWETSLNQLGELDARIKQSVGSVTQSQNTKEEYSYLVYDRFEKAMKGNLREPITQADHVFCDTAKFVHEQFNNSPTLRDVTLRSRSSGVYCKRNLGRETYFQRKGSFRAFPGVPYPRDPTFTLEKRSGKVLLKEHGINVF